MALIISDGVCQFQIYCDGRLLFCDHIFNGYGNTKKDFKKQIMNSRKDFAQGFSLPKDFKFRYLLIISKGHVYMILTCIICSVQTLYIILCVLNSVCLLKINMF